MEIKGRYLFHEIKPNSHCGDFHETDAHSTPFSKETLYRFFGNVTNCFSLILFQKQREYRENNPASFFFKIKTGRKTFQQMFGYQPQSNGCCLDIDICVFNYVTARKVLYFCKLTSLKGRNMSIKA
jgi:hypothetical protein